MTTENLVARCSIYENRPKLCVDYPRVDHYMPPECTFKYVGNEREGRCECNIGACCAVPRDGGEPGGTPMPDVAGGEPCKYLTWEPVMGSEREEPKEKAAASREYPDLTPLVDGSMGKSYSGT